MIIYAYQTFGTILVFEALDTLAIRTTEQAGRLTVFMAFTDGRVIGAGAAGK